MLAVHNCSVLGSPLPQKHVASLEVLPVIGPVIFVQVSATMQRHSFEVVHEVVLVLSSFKNRVVSKAVSVLLNDDTEPATTQLLDVPKEQPHGFEFDVVGVTTRDVGSVIVPMLVIMTSDAS